MMLKEGLSHTSVLTVTEAYTAQALGSGDLPVLGTPAMLALMENAAMLAVANELEEGQTTVGGYLGASHVKPSKLGATVDSNLNKGRPSQALIPCCRKGEWRGDWRR